LGTNETSSCIDPGSNGHSISAVMAGCDYSLPALGRECRPRCHHAPCYHCNQKI